jgi:glutathione S-transferase
MIRSMANSNYRFELVSFKMCPFVQRSVITLKHKKAPFEITYIDLKSPPAWFDKISPLGQVPLLKVNGETVLFESAVINEFLDEVVGQPLHPRDPLAKARERAWIEYSSELYRGMYKVALEKKPAKREAIADEFFTDLARVEEVISREGPYFRGKEFGLVDTAYAPLFMRLLLSDLLAQDPRWKRQERLVRWAKALLELPEVRESVVPEFNEQYRAQLVELRNSE